MKRRTRSWLLVVLLVSVTACCLSPEEPAEPVHSEIETLSWAWKTNLGSAEGWSAGQWVWAWSCGDSILGTADLRLESLDPEPSGWKVSWNFTSEFGSPLPQGRITFRPAETGVWYTFIWENSSHESLAILPFPIPCQTVQSTHYSGLLDLLQTLTTPYFEQIVTHWPQYPVPVRLVPAVNDSVDLTSCLTEAMEIWNAGESEPWFQQNPDAGWGIRLVHFPDRTLHPPLAAQITRLDPQGRPLRVHLLAGNNYDDPRDRIYAVRGFVHELGHALFLWGHSLDRLHSLWGRAPPLVAAPSEDERKAAHWWHGLPDGLDLSLYEAGHPGDQ